MKRRTTYTCAPRPSAEQIAYVLNRPRSSPGYICRDGENGWDFICDSSADYAGQTHRHRYGVMGRAYPVVRSTSTLPPEGPVPQRAAFLTQEETRLENERRRLALVDLNMAREDQLVALGLDPQVARRIILRAIDRHYTSVDELLTVEGVDRTLVERVRPHVRIGLTPVRGDWVNVPENLSASCTGMFTVPGQEKSSTHVSAPVSRMWRMRCHNVGLLVFRRTENANAKRKTQNAKRIRVFLRILTEAT